MKHYGRDRGQRCRADTTLHRVAPRYVGLTIMMHPFE